jgi:hypothetical protein
MAQPAGHFRKTKNSVIHFCNSVTTSERVGAIFAGQNLKNIELIDDGNAEI